MKKIALPLLVLLLINSAFSQWSQISTVNTTQLNAVKFFNEYTGITAGVGGIWRSTNSGFNWTQVLSGVNMNTVSFLNSSIGLAAGSEGKIAKTTDGGTNWIFVSNPDTADIFVIQYINSSIVMAAGEAGHLLKSTNSGSLWYNLNSGTTQDLKGIYMSDPLNGFISGGLTHELCATTTNGGSNWIYALNQSGNFLNSITSPFEFFTIIGVGSNGRVRKTTNRGTTWSVIQSGVGFELNSIYFIDYYTGYVTGNNGTIIKSTNNGANWTIQQSNTTENLKCINLINANTGWAVGQNGIILRTGIPVNIQQTGNNIPIQFKLYQNYPNPFNPETNIRFDISKNGYVELEIFDFLGKSKKKLTNSYLQAGEYFSNVNFSEFSSGIYIIGLKYKKSTEAKISFEFIKVVYLR